MDDKVEEERKDEIHGLGCHMTEREIGYQSLIFIPGKGLSHPLVVGDELVGPCLSRVHHIVVRQHYGLELPRITRSIHDITDSVRHHRQSLPLQPRVPNSVSSHLEEFLPMDVS